MNETPLESKESGHRGIADGFARVNKCVVAMETVGRGNSGLREKMPCGIGRWMERQIFFPKKELSFQLQLNFICLTKARN